MCWFLFAIFIKPKSRRIEIIQRKKWVNWKSIILHIIFSISDSKRKIVTFVVCLIKQCFTDMNYRRSQKKPWLQKIATDAESCSQCCKETRAFECLDNNLLLMISIKIPWMDYLQSLVCLGNSFFILTNNLWALLAHLAWRILCQCSNGCNGDLHSRLSFENRQANVLCSTVCAHIIFIESYLPLTYCAGVSFITLCSIFSEQLQNFTEILNCWSSHRKGFCFRPSKLLSQVSFPIWYHYTRN